jgi:hypothetical protein
MHIDHLFAKDTLTDGMPESNREYREQDGEEWESTDDEWR